MANMLNIQTTSADTLPPFLAHGMAGLTNPDSLHRKWITGIAEGRRPDDVPDDLVFAVCMLDDEFDLTPVAWVSLHLWDGIPCLEGFVAPEHRRKRLASACTAVLLQSVPLQSTEVGVFSDEFEKIAAWAGVEQVVRYKRVDDGWVKRHV